MLILTPGCKIYAVASRYILINFSLFGKILWFNTLDVCTLDGDRCYNKVQFGERLHCKQLRYTCDPFVQLVPFKVEVEYGSLGGWMDISENWHTCWTWYIGFALVVAIMIKWMVIFVKINTL